MDERGHARAALELIIAGERSVESAIDHLLKSGADEAPSNLAMSIFKRIERLKTTIESGAVLDKGSQKEGRKHE